MSSSADRGQSLPPGERGIAFPSCAMTDLMRLAVRNVWPMLMLIVGLSFMAAHQLPRLTIDVSSQIFVSGDDPARDLYDRNIDTFGSDNITVVIFRDIDLENPDRIRDIRDAIDNIESLRFVTHTDSLFTIPNLVNEDGFLKADPFITDIPDSSFEVIEILLKASQSPLAVDNLISSDGMTIAVNVHIVDNPDDPDFANFVTHHIEKAVGEIKGNFESVIQVGKYYVRQNIADQVERDRLEILPVSLGVLLLVLVLVLRRISAALIPLLTAGISVLWTLAFMAVVGIPLNVMTSIVPVILVIIGSTEDVHLITEFYEARRQNRGRAEAVDMMASKMGLAVTLTFLTSYLGFVSITTNRIELLWQFGLLASTGLLFNFILTAVIVPIYLRYLSGTARTASARIRQRRYQWLVDAICFVVNRRKLVITAVLLMVVAIAGVGASWLQVNNNVVSYFPKGSEVRDRLAVMDETLGGTQSFSVMFESGIEGTFKKVRYLSEIQKLQGYLENSGLFGKTTSVADYLAVVNGVIGEQDVFGLPESDEAVTELLLFIKNDYIRRFVTEDFASANLVVRHGISSSNQLKKELAKIESFIAENIDPGIQVRLTGESILTSRATDEMAFGQAKSLGLMILIIFVVIALLFMNVKAGLLAIIPNSLPIIVLFGVMGFAGIPLDIGTAMVAAIAVGICVDNTMHFMVRYNYELQQEADQAVAMSNTIRGEATPIFATTLALAGGFSVLMMSGFAPVVYFGFLSALVVVLALLADFFITPLLLASTRLVTVWDLLSLKLRAQLITRCRLFDGMRPSQIRKIILVSVVRRYAAGEVIYRQGDVTESMYIILEGKVECRKDTGDGNTEVMAAPETGELFGEVALVSDELRLANAVAVEHTRVLVMSWDSLRRVARAYPRLSSQLFQNLSSILGKRLVDQVPI